MRRVLAIGLSLGTACATSADLGPRTIAPDLRVGSLSERTRFEADATGTTLDRDASPEKNQRLRKGLFWTGIGMIGFGVAGFTGFGIGGRVVQKQIKDGYDDGSLTFDEEDRLQSTGEIMNGLAIGSVVVGLVGVVLAAAVYGVDNAKCGQLKPRRKACRAGEDAMQLDAAGASPAPGDPRQPADGAPDTTGPAGPPPPTPPDPRPESTVPLQPGPRDPAPERPDIGPTPAPGGTRGPGGTGSGTGGGAGGGAGGGGGGGGVALGFFGHGPAAR